MSTSYYRLRKPVTYLALSRPEGMHNSLRIWINHALAATITLRKEETNDVLRLLSQDGDDFEARPLHTYWNGELGAVVIVNDKTIHDEELVISDYGELLTVQQVKARNGAKRKDGKPTELFGYEDE